jgi:hypothetical protein
MKDFLAALIAGFIFGQMLTAMAIAILWYRTPLPFYIELSQ